MALLASVQLLPVPGGNNNNIIIYFFNRMNMKEFMTISVYNNSMTFSSH
jgi:hypothetical protein